MTTTTFTPALTRPGRLVILAVGFLGWLFAGTDMSITQQVGQEAAIDLLDRTGALELDKLQAWNKLLQQQEDKQALPPGMSAQDKALVDQWNAQVARWFAWFQCA